MAVDALFSLDFRITASAKTAAVNTAQLREYLETGAVCVVIC